jgi:hypothetical protein
MNLDRVTITGPDDSIRPEDLIGLTKEFPFVEWGILHSASNRGNNRFPSHKWMCDLQDLAGKEHLPLSLHLCGRYVRELLFGGIPESVLTFLPMFRRVQLNFHAERNECHPKSFFEALKKISEGQREFIFQLDGALGNQHMDAVRAIGELNTFGLFDVSGGAGILPTEWPSPIYYRDMRPDYHGYAGGLGPDNLAEQMPLIGKAAKGCRFWIDMETRVRSDNDRQFDLAKVRKCLELSRPFVKGPA